MLDYNNNETTTAKGSTLRAAINNNETNMNNHKAEIITNDLTETVYRMNQKTFAEVEANNKKMAEGARRSYGIKATIYHPRDLTAPVGWSDGKVGEMHLDYGWTQIMEQTHEADIEVLDKIWAGWNNGSGCECAEFYDADVRSMMVGDFVKLDSEIYRCARTGWERATRSELTKAIR